MGIENEQRVVILAFDWQNGESNIEQVNDCLLQGFLVIDVLFVNPAAYLLTLSDNRHTALNVTRGESKTFFCSRKTNLRRISLEVEAALSEASHQEVDFKETNRPI